MCCKVCSSNWRRTRKSRCKQLERPACRRALGSSSDQGRRGPVFTSLKRTGHRCERSKRHWLERLECLNFPGEFNPICLWVCVHN